MREAQAAAHLHGKGPPHAALCRCNRCFRVRGRPRHQAASKRCSRSSFRGEQVAGVATSGEQCRRWVGWPLACRRHAEKHGAQPCGAWRHCMPSIYRFFRNFCIHFCEPPVGVLVCDSWVCKTGAGSWTVTLYDPVSWCVCSTHCETCLHTRARVHEDQDDLWRVTPVFVNVELDRCNVSQLQSLQA